MCFVRVYRVSWNTTRSHFSFATDWFSFSLLQSEKSIMTTAKTERKLEIGGHEKKRSGKTVPKKRKTSVAPCVRVRDGTIYDLLFVADVSNTKHQLPCSMGACTSSCMRKRERAQYGRYAMRNLTPTHLVVSTSPSREIHFFLVMICGSNRSSATFVFVLSAHLLTYWESVTIIADVSSDRWNQTLHAVLLLSTEKKAFYLFGFEMQTKKRAATCSNYLKIMIIWTVLDSWPHTCTHTSRAISNWALIFRWRNGHLHFVSVFCHSNWKLNRFRQSMIDVFLFCPHIEFISFPERLIKT